MTSSPKILGTAMLACALAFPFTAAFTTAAQTPPTQPPAPVPAVLQNYKPVTAERLKNPEDSDWLMVRRTYNGWGYSPLFQITTANVQRLQPVWVLATGVNNGHEAAPIVNNGIMFVATPENQNGYYMTLAPLVAAGKVMVGASGGELGIRGFVAAFDPDTGKELWRVYTVPAPGEPGSETWPEGNQWKTGGGPVWVTGNYDPETNLAFWGTGNGGPWMGDQRPGDNLFTASTIAVDVASGKIKGFHQYNPNESWDWDEVSPPLLVDYKRGGRTIKGLIDVARDGYLWFLERTDGAINFVEGEPFVKQNVFKSVDPKTGRPEVDPDHKPGTGKKADFCPSHWGGKNWPPAAFSPRTRMLYIPAKENLCATITAREVEYSPGSPFTGATSTLAMAPGADHIGEVQAWDVDTGKRVWTHTYAKSPNWGPMLATGGGVVFSGGTNDRMFHAFDASTGQLLWEFPTNSGIIGQPSSFMVDGKQYVAVQSGWGIDSRAMEARLNTLFPGEYPEVPEGGAIWVFAVK